MLAQEKTPDTADVRGSNEEFRFEHKLFSVNSCVFRRTGGAGGGVALYMPLGNVMVAVPVDKIVKTFDIATDSADAALLTRVAAALKYVQEIRPGDSIPSEIISGRASWMVDPKFLAAAKAKISLQLVAWLTGNHVDDLDINEFVVLAERSDIREKVQEAFSSIAEKLGFGAERKQEVVELVDRFAIELSYVEALRDRFNELRHVVSKLKTLSALYRRDRTTVEVIARCSTLLAKPVQRVLDKFVAFDANVGEILNTLQRFDAQVVYVRDTRDELRDNYLYWEEMIRLWENQKAVSGSEAERAIQETYRFAARNFSAGVAWPGG
ncbi:MAG TPA: hypothetical protein VG328_11600 [Stellaceae bacterium]|jgi:hypothetical protein|nr:hypothetical protein [Stellaceae bacterium]